MTKRSRAKKGEGDKLREEILETAAAVLAETGNADLTPIRTIANRLGITPPSIYLHFKDKDDLIFQTCLRTFQEFEAAMLSIIAGERDDLKKLRKALSGYIFFALDNEEHYRVMFMGRDDNIPDYVDRESMPGWRSLERLIDIIVSLQMQRILIDGDPFVIAVGLWATMHGTASLIISRPGFRWPDRVDLIAHITTAHVRGLLKDPSDANS